MTLKEWIDSQGSGAITRLARESGLAYTTILAAISGKSSTRYSTAKRISDVTGGAVSIHDICDRSD